jgi:hypothetical protein
MGMAGIVMLFPQICQDTIRINGDHACPPADPAAMNMVTLTLTLKYHKYVY